MCYQQANIASTIWLEIQLMNFELHEYVAPYFRHYIQPEMLIFAPKMLETLNLLNIFLIYLNIKTCGRFVCRTLIFKVMCVRIFITINLFLLQIMKMESV